MFQGEQQTARPEERSLDNLREASLSGLRSIVAEGPYGTLVVSSDWQTGHIAATWNEEGKGSAGSLDCMAWHARTRSRPSEDLRSREAEGGRQALDRVDVESASSLYWISGPGGVPCACVPVGIAEDCGCAGTTWRSGGLGRESRAWNAKNGPAWDGVVEEFGWTVI